MRSDPRLVLAAVAAVAVCAVFACAFAIGRVTNSGHATLAEGPSALAITSGGPAIPVGLSNAPPLDTGRVESRVPAPNRRSAAPARAAAQPLSSRVFPAPVQISKPAPSLSAEPSTSSAPPPVQAPVPAPARSLPRTGSSGSGGGSSGGGGSGGGASFDSSG